MVAVRAFIAIAVLAAGGCLGLASPEQDERQAQGPYEDGDEEHRPGQPCLVCHRADFSPGDDVFDIAGTVFLRPTDDDENGLAGAIVHITDDEGRELEVVTNRAGNFMVKVEGGATGRQENGKLEINWHPTFPLRVMVRLGAVEQEMESRIWREGSCAGCHRGSEPTGSSVEKVFVEEVP